jgi:hypothetical protein
VTESHVAGTAPAVVVVIPQEAAWDQRPFETRSAADGVLKG